MRPIPTLNGLATTLLFLTCSAVGAQTPPPKAADGKTLSMGLGSSGGKLLARDELRTCFTQRDVLAGRLSEADGQRKALDAERDAIGQERAALVAERTELDKKTEVVKALAPRLEAFKLKFDNFQARVTAFNEANRTGMSADRQRAELQREQVELQASQKALEAERLASIGPAEEAVNRFNASAAAVEAKATDWNQRNGKLNEQSQAVADDRQTWVTECGNRRYREDDETAIRKGQ